jgi:hypothetical protein
MRFMGKKTAVRLTAVLSFCGGKLLHVEAGEQLTQLRGELARCRISQDDPAPSNRVFRESGPRNRAPYFRANRRFTFARRRSWRRRLPADHTPPDPQEIALLRDFERNLAGVVGGTARDPKVEVILHYLRERNWLKGNGAITFSQHRTTAEWVLEALCAAFPDEPIALYAGGAASFVQRGTDRARLCESRSKQILCRRGPEPHRPAGAAQVDGFPRAPLVGRCFEIILARIGRGCRGPLHHRARRRSLQVGLPIEVHEGLRLPWLDHDRVEPRRAGAAELAAADALDRCEMAAHSSPSKSSSPKSGAAAGGSAALPGAGARSAWA